MCKEYIEDIVIIIMAIVIGIVLAVGIIPLFH